MENIFFRGDSGTWTHFVVCQDYATYSVKSVHVVMLDQAPAACIGDFLVGLLAKSEYLAICKVSPVAFTVGDMTRLQLSERGLLNFLTESNGSLQKLIFQGFDLKEEHFRDRPGLDVVLEVCTIDPSALDLFLECLVRNRGQTGLEFCKIKTGLLVDALCGSMRLKELKLERGHVCNDDLYPITSALAFNRSLVELYLCNVKMSDTNWGGLHEALRTHPNLRVLGLSNIVFDEDADYASQTLVAIMRSNTVLEVIGFSRSSCYSRRIFEELVVPRLEMNRSFFADQRIAIKTAPIAVRPKLLGRALVVVRFNPNLLFLFLSENVDVVATAKGSRRPSPGP